MLRRSLVLAATFACATALALPVVAQEPVAAEPVQLARALVEPATVFMHIEFSAWVWDSYNEQSVGDTPFEVGYTCSGFLIHPDGYLVTAGHCVDIDAQVRADLIDRAAVWAFENRYYADETLTLSTIRGFAAEDYVLVSSDDEVGEADRVVSVYIGVSVSGIETGKKLPARLLELRPFDEGDIALLKIEGKDLPVVELGDASTVDVGTGVVSVGYAGSVQDVTDFSLRPSFKDGSVSSLRTIGNGLISVLEISAAVSHGMSGGPTVDDSGAVVGVNSFGNRFETQPFNFIIPVSIVEEVLKSEGITNEISGVNKTYREAIAAFFEGDADRAVELLERVLQTQPGHPVAQEYLAKARDIVEDEVAETTTTNVTAPTNDSETLGMEAESPGSAGLALGGIAAVAAGIGATVVLRRRREVSSVTSDLSNPNDPFQRLQLVVDLADKGLLSAEEFESAKAAILRDLADDSATDTTEALALSSLS